MNVYLYRAALYCAPCGERLRRELPAPEDASDERSYDSDAYPKGPYPDGGGEADCPQACDACRAFLENPLTDDGRDYVAEAVADALARILKGIDATIDPGSVLATWIAHYDVHAGVVVGRGSWEGEPSVLTADDLVREPETAAERAAGERDE